MKEETISVKISLDSVRILVAKLFEYVNAEAKNHDQKLFLGSQIKSKLMRNVVYVNKTIAICYCTNMVEESLEKTAARLRGYLEKTSSSKYILAKRQKHKIIST